VNLLAEFGVDAATLSLSLPVPGTLLQVTWLIIGFMFGRAFAKYLDRTIQAADEFKCQNKLTQTLVKNALNFLHHFWMGLLLIVYASQIASPLRIEADVVAFFGLGLFLDDLPDVPRRFRKYFASLFGSQGVAP
jgi:hypothetical protein